MDAKEIEIVNTIIKLFRAAIASYKIYPVGSKMISNRVESLNLAINDYLKKNSSITISESNNKLLVDGQEIKLSEMDLISIFEAFQLQSIVFRKGYTIDELNAVVELLSKRKEQIDELGGINKIITEKNFVNVEFNSIKYVAVEKGHEIVKKVSELVDKLNEQPSAFLQSLRYIYDTIDEIKNPEIKKNMIGLLAKKLATLEPSQIREFFENESPDKINSSALKEAVISELPQEKLSEIRDEVLKWYEDIKKNAKSEFDAAEQLSKLSKFINTILNAPSAKGLPFSFFEELLNIGLLTKLPEYVTADEKSNLLSVVNNLLSKNSSDLLEKNILDNIPDIIKKLCHAEFIDLAEKLSAKLAENLKQSSIKIRSDTIRTLLKISDELIAAHKEKVLKTIELKFIDEIKKETNINLYKDLAELLRKRIFYLYLNNEYENAISIISIFKHSSIPELEPDTKKVNIVKEIISKIVTDIIDLLIADLKSGIEKRQNYAIKIITMLGGEDISNTLISLIKDTEDYRTRKIIATVLKFIDDKNIDRLVDSISFELTTQSLLRKLEVIETMGKLSDLTKIIYLLDYPNSLIKKTVLRYLFKTYPDESKEFFIKKLDDKDLDVVIDAVRYLGELRCKSAVDKIIKLTKIENNELLEEICIAFGKINDEKTIPILMKFLRPEKNLFGISKKSVPDTVRIRAAWALGRFPYNEQIVKLLEYIMNKDTDINVRKAAKESVENIKKSKLTV